jgi:hypothetical protein
MLHWREKFESLNIFENKNKATGKSQHSWKYSKFCSSSIAKHSLRLHVGRQGCKLLSFAQHHQVISSSPYLSTSLFSSCCYYCWFPWCIVIRWKWVIMKISFDFYSIKYKLNTLLFGHLILYISTLQYIVLLNTRRAVWFSFKKY